MLTAKNTGVFEKLQSDILRIQGFKSICSHHLSSGFGPLAQCFPQGIFPLAAVHEFLSTGKEGRAATSGFIAGMLSLLLKDNGTVLWLSSCRSIFPPALKSFNVKPDKFIFIDLKNEREILWSMEEALKCSAVTSVVAEIKDLSFTASRRLQLAVEKSNTTGFVIRPQYQKQNTTTCVSRWKITSLPSEPIDNLPGVGYPHWNVELLRMRNGKAGNWNLCWRNGKFVPTLQLFPGSTAIPLEPATLSHRKTG